MTILRVLRRVGIYAARAATPANQPSGQTARASNARPYNLTGKFAATARFLGGGKSGWCKTDKSEFVKEIYNMKKVCLAVLPALTIVLELLPLGAVCIFATSPTERVKETFSYFSLTPFGYANFAPLITATLTVAIFLLSLFSLKKKGVLKALFVLSIITVVISLLPLMYGLNYYTLVGAFITVTLVIESILAKIQQK